ncbi:hypothetical protein V492_00386 [Pseudogymnoascus sp. VKM F-4246]|nr:hypothetical protein V492_00386 [Pseudogymnoascus sp. VKM F-4246]
MDPLSVTASIIAIVQLTSVIIGFLNDVKDASKDRARCAIEVSNVSSLLVALIYRLEEASANDGWYTEVQSLAAANGPIDQYRSALEQLQSKLTSTASNGLKKFGSALTWKFSKEEVTNILTRIERLKSLTQIALEMDHFKLSQALKNDTTVITSTVRSLQENQDSQQYRVITDWLSSTDFPAQQSDFIGRRAEGTGQWFVVSPEFTNWLQETKQRLFCPGIPGAGKTMITAIAVDYIWKAFQGNNVGIAYVYCNYKRQETQTATDLLAAILKQLVQERPLYGEPVATLHKRHADRRTRPSLDEICSALNSVLINYAKAYIIIDALDECIDSDGTRSDLLTILQNLQAKSNISLMATSRFNARIEQSFQGSSMLEIQASDADVTQFVAGYIRRLPKCVQRDPELQAEIQDGIVQAVDGMFLLARLHVDSLRGKGTKKEIRSTLKNLPKGLTALSKAYDEAIERIEGQLPEESTRAKRVLSWIIYAERQLTTKELSHALAVEAGESELDKDNILDIEDMISVCAGLVAVDEKSDVIRLVHYTAQEYFERVREAWNPKAQEEIASTCLTYLSFQTFDTGHCYNDEDFERRIIQNPFLDYAARYWGNHALTVQQAIEKLALLFLRNMNQVSCSNQVMSVPNYRYQGYSQAIPMEVIGIHIVADFGLAHLLQELTHGGGNEYCMYIDARASNGRTPLWIAAEHGREAVVRLLVEREDVEADSKDEHGRTPLWIAAERGHKAVVRLLVERDDVEADLRDKRGWTPLWIAALRGHEAVVRLLVEREDVDADSKDERGRTPLSWAAETGHEAVVRLLVEREDVEADSKSKGGQTLWLLVESGRTHLLWPADGRDEATVTLVERGDVDADSKNNGGRTPLLWAAKGGHEAVVKLLVEREDVEADLRHKRGWTPLSWAAESGNEAVVRLLVEREDVDADSKDECSRTPLSWAAEHGHEAVVRLLVEREDVEADLRDKRGWTPLSWAAESGNEAVVRLLVEREDVEANSKDECSRTPLWIAALHGFEAVVRLLVEQEDIEADLKDERGRTALWIAAERGHETVVRLLVERDDVEADSKDEYGWTPLWIAALRGHEAVVRLLMEREDVEADSKDEHGRTPLSWAAERGHQGGQALMRLLVEQEDVEADSKDEDAVVGSGAQAQGSHEAAHGAGGRRGRLEGQGGSDAAVVGSRERSRVNREAACGADVVTDSKGHGLTDFTMQLMLLKQHNIKRLLVARQEQLYEASRPLSAAHRSGFR